MKKIIIVALVLNLSILQIYAQKLKENEVSTVIKTAFSKAYPKVQEVKWEKEDGNYEAEFQQNKKEISVLLDETGIVKAVKTEISQKDLPKTIQDVLAKDYAGYKVEEAANIEAAGMLTYEAEIEKGKDVLQLVFDAAGKILKKEQKHDAD